MTNSNRFLNRLFVFVCGLILLVVGGSVAAGALIPGVQQTVAQAASDVRESASNAWESGSWILWITALVAIVLVILLLAFVVRHGGGRTSTLLRERSGDGSHQPNGGSLVIDAKVAQQVLEEALSHDSDIVSVDVTAFEVKGQTVLRLTAHARRGASPAEVRRSIDRTVREWDALLGRETPIVVQIVSGLRTQVSGATARVV